MAVNIIPTRPSSRHSNHPTRNTVPKMATPCSARPAMEASTAYVPSPFWPPWPCSPAIWRSTKTLVPNAAAPGPDPRQFGSQRRRTKSCLTKTTEDTSKPAAKPHIRRTTEDILKQPSMKTAQDASSVEDASEEDSEDILGGGSFGKRR